MEFLSTLMFGVLLSTVALLFASDPTSTDFSNVAATYSDIDPTVEHTISDVVTIGSGGERAIESSSTNNGESVKMEEKGDVTVDHRQPSSVGSSKKTTSAVNKDGADVVKSAGETHNNITNEQPSSVMDEPTSLLQHSDSTFLPWLTSVETFHNPQVTTESMVKLIKLIPSLVATSAKELNLTWKVEDIVDVSDGSYRVFVDGIQNDRDVPLNATSSLSWTDLIPGQLYIAKIQICGQNRVNCGKFFTAENNTFPEKPSNVTVNETSPGSVSLTWYQDGVANIIDVEVRIGEMVESNRSQTGWWNSTWVELDLGTLPAAGSKYNLTIKACSRSLCSESAEVEIQSGPAAPKDLHVNWTNASSAFFSWRQEGFYEDFELTIRPDDCKWNYSLNSSLKEGCVTSLPCPGAEYELRVRARNHGLWSDFQNLIFHSALSVPSVQCYNRSNSSLGLKVESGWNQSEAMECCSSGKVKQNFNLSYKLTLVKHNSSENEADNESAIDGGPDFMTLENENVRNISGLEAGASYEFRVKAVVGNLKSDEAVITCMTELNIPLNVAISNVTSQSALLEWTRPGGHLNDFVVECYGQQNDSIHFTTSSEKTETVCENLTAGALYHASIRSRLSVGEMSGSVKKTFITEPLEPSIVKQLNVSLNSLKLSVRYDYAAIEAKCTHFLIVSIGDGVNLTEACSKSEILLEGLASNRHHEFAVYTLSNYSEGHRLSTTSFKESFLTLPQNVSNLTADARSPTSLNISWHQCDHVKGNNSYELLLSNSSNHWSIEKFHIVKSNDANECGSDPMEHVLQNLISGMNYTITLWAVNEAGRSTLQSIHERTLDVVDDTSLTHGAVVGGIIGFMVVILVAVSAGGLFLKFRKRPKRAIPSSKRPSCTMGFPNPSFTLGMESAEICESMKPKPIPLDKFIERLEELHNDSDYCFSAEYALLTELSPRHSQNAAELEENRTKNRYSNILPFDHSRVKLIPFDDDEVGSDYINASFMPGYVSKREFIAAQGPMKSTVDDFWRMIWEQNTNTVVMVTNLQERGREKCAEYWPNDEEPVFYGDLQVQLKSESQLNYYIIRVLDVRLGEKKRVIKHLHFISWPDFGCPENTSVLLDFVLGVRSHMTGQPSSGSSPILVHCSAGVGRTGTFIIIDRLLQHIKTHSYVDIFGIVLEMRSYRCNMIQTEAQYIFAHECIKTAIERQQQQSDETADEAEDTFYENVGKKSDGVYENVTSVNKNMETVQL